jgi:hypothetical protein
MLAVAKSDSLPHFLQKESMRAVLVIALAFPCSALTAQLSRFSITPEIGRVWPTSIVEHTQTYPVVAGFPQASRHQRLWVHPAQLFGATLEFSAGRGWIVYASGRGSSETVVQFHDSTAPTDVVQRAPAKIKLWELGVGKNFRFGERLPRLRATLGGGSYRFALDKIYYCNLFQCLPSPPWRSHYNIPTLVGGLLLRQPVTTHIALELGGKESVGRANTEDFFFFLPYYLENQFETPKNRIVRTTQLSLGISIF